MDKKIQYFVFLILLIWPYITNAQIDSIRNIQPVLTSVSVQPGTGFTELNWAYIPSSFVAGYKLFYFNYDYSGAFLFKTLWSPASLSYVDSSRFANSYSVPYQIEAIDIMSNPSQLSNRLNTIFITTAIDTCNKKIMVVWNKYPSVPKIVSNYSILVSVNGGSFFESGKAGAEESSYILNNFSNDANYCFVVRANLEGGLYSSSNKACLVTKMQRPPDWINADYATIDEKKNIKLKFTIDPFSEISNFRIERKTENESGFSLITQLETAERIISFTDKTASAFKKNYYRLLAVNNCNNPVVTSNISGNIVPVLEKNGNILTLKWNPYSFWLGELSGYKIYINTGSGFREESTILPSDTVYTVDYSSVMYDLSANNLCYFVSAYETANPHGVSGQSSSAVTCLEIIENITVPNAFTPNDDLVNDLFKPVLSFTPTDYNLIITDRKNNLLFESHDPMAAWNGKRNGETLPEGVYLWFVKVKTPSGKVLTRTGTVAIIK